jgi:hypothetical protein
MRFALASIDATDTIHGARDTLGSVAALRTQPLSSVSTTILQSAIALGGQAGAAGKAGEPAAGKPGTPGLPGTFSTDRSFISVRDVALGHTLRTSSDQIRLNSKSDKSAVSYFHEGGIVGKTTDTRSVSSSVFTNATKYHSGGLVGLSRNEVPAILMGGPKGTREEVLRGDDPRHQDNIAPQLLRMIQTERGQQSVLSMLSRSSDNSEKFSANDHSFHVDRLLQHDRETREVSPLTRFLMGSPATVSSLIKELSKENDTKSVEALREIRVSGNRELGGPVSANSLYRVNEKGPELLEVAGKQYLMTGNSSGTVKEAPKRASDVHFSPTYVFNTPVDRRTADQVHAHAGRGVQKALARSTG